MKININDLLEKRLKMLTSELEAMNKREDSTKDDITLIKGQIKEIKSLLFILA